MKEAENKAESLPTIEDLEFEKNVLKNNCISIEMKLADKTRSSDAEINKIMKEKEEIEISKNNYRDECNKVKQESDSWKERFTRKEIDYIDLEENV